MAVAAAAGLPPTGASGGGDKKRKKPADNYKGSEDEFNYNCDILDKLYQEVDLERKGSGSNSFSSLSSSNAATAGTPASKAGAAAAAAERKADSKTDAKKPPIPGEGSRFIGAMRRPPHGKPLRSGICLA